MESQKKSPHRFAFPWLTLALALLATVALLFDPVSGLFIYDRALIYRGELWRAWTGHVVHFGLSHFIWNLAVFIPSGCWLERWWPGWTRWFYILCPLLISAALLRWDPSLTRYAGLSGVATGMLVLLAGFQLGRGPEEPAGFWWSVLALVGAKIVLELFTGKPLLVSGFGDIRTVPLAHIFGAVGGLLFWAARNGVRALAATGGRR